MYVAIVHLTKYHYWLLNFLLMYVSCTATDLPAQTTRPHRESPLDRGGYSVVGLHGPKASTCYLLGLVYATTQTDGWALCEGCEKLKWSEYRLIWLASVWLLHTPACTRMLVLFSHPLSLQASL